MLGCYEASCPVAETQCKAHSSELPQPETERVWAGKNLRLTSHWLKSCHHSDIKPQEGLLAQEEQVLATQGESSHSWAKHDSRARLVGLGRVSKCRALQQQKHQLLRYCIHHMPGRLSAPSAGRLKAPKSHADSF